MTGRRFGHWTVLELAEPLYDKRGYKVHRWKCRCDCGTIKDVSGTSLRSGRSTSCGCDRSVAREVCKNNFTTHGETKTRLYQIWAGVHKRCENSNAYNYSDYGGRGIKVSDEWRSFIPFKDWAVSNGYTDGLSIDRIDVNGNYSPDNCRWVDSIAQANNRRNNHYITFNGETKTIAEWARDYNMNYKKLYKRIASGKSLSDALKN